MSKVRGPMNITYSNSLKPIMFEYYKKGYKQRDVVEIEKVSKQVVSKWYIYFRKNYIK